jgi:hypothetical protein
MVNIQAFKKEVEKDRLAGRQANRKAGNNAYCYVDRKEGCLESREEGASYCRGRKKDRLIIKLGEKKRARGKG